ncbi:DUF481 domain-containing protein [Sphingomonas sp. MMS24-JH45]
MEAGGFASSGNSNITGLTGAADLTREGLRWRHRLLAQADYQRTDGITTAASATCSATSPITSSTSTATCTRRISSPTASSATTIASAGRWGSAMAWCGARG